MLWSLIKIVLFICIVAALTLGAGYLLETDGGIRVAIGTLEFNLGPLQAVVAVVALVVAIWLFLKLMSLMVAVVRFLNWDETALSRWFDRNRERKGFDALADALMAVASGEGRTAMAKAAKADRYLNRPELTNLITAQAAEISGDTERAEQVYRELLNDDRTRFVGVRGLMNQQLAKGNTETAMKLAEKAFTLKPRHEETQDVLLRLQADQGDWSGARQTLGAKLRYGNIPRNLHRRRDAVLALGQARKIVDEGQTIEAREAAIQANKLSPDLVPAAVMAAHSYIEKGQSKYASRVIQKAWQITPHPDLAGAYAQIAPDESPEARLKRFQSLTRLHPGAPETRMLQAELEIAAENFPAARRAMGSLAEDRPTARSLTIMAAIVRGEGGDDSEVKAYLARAVHAPRGPQWVCENCHNLPGDWEPVCSNCGAFDTMSWMEAPEASRTAEPPAGVLPLIVGEPAAPDTPETAQTIETEESDRLVAANGVASTTPPEPAATAPQKSP